MGKGAILIAISLFFLATAISVSAQVACCISAGNGCNQISATDSCVSGQKSVGACDVPPNDATCEFGCCCIGGTSLGDQDTPLELISWQGCYQSWTGYTWTTADPDTDNCVNICGGTTGPTNPGTAAHCSDGIPNFDELGIDCGGVDCPACPTASPGVCDIANVDQNDFETDELSPLTQNAGSVNLIWDDSFATTCVPGEVTYYVMRSSSSGGPYNAISPLLTGTTYTDSTVTEGQRYFYAIYAIIPGGDIYSNEHFIDIEDSICESMPPSQFCYQGSVHYCINGLLTLGQDCSGQGSCIESGSSATCITVNCDDCNGLYGLYGHQGRSIDYTITRSPASQVACTELVTRGACVLDSSDTVADYFWTCRNTGGCFDYIDKDACEMDTCRYECQWNDLYGVAQSNTLGLGICVPKDDPVATCQQCNGLPNCDQNLCTSIGACYWDGSTCLANQLLTCNDYTTSADCDNGLPVNVNVQYFGTARSGGTHIVTASGDNQALGKCYWNYGGCYKDADGRHDWIDRDDCITDSTDPGYDPRCSSDFEAPFTTILTNPGISMPNSFTVQYSVFDNAYLPGEIQTFYCLIESGSCYPDQLATGGTIPVVIPNTNVRLYYYSVDPAKNLEAYMTKYVEFSTDASPPVILSVGVSAPPQNYDVFTSIYTSAADFGNLTGAVSPDTQTICVTNDLSLVTQCISTCGAGSNFCIDSNNNFIYPIVLIEKSGLVRNNLIVNASDAAGNSAIGIVTVDKDATAPSDPVFSIRTVPDNIALTPRPNIVVNYSEDVTITNVDVTGPNGTMAVTQTPLTGVDMNFIFQPDFLENGDYTLTVDASDDLGNTVTSTYDFSVNAPFIISLMEPPFGSSNVTPYDIEVETSKDAHCTWSLNQGTGLSFNWFEDASGTTESDTIFIKNHYLRDATWASNKFYVTCSDGTIELERMFPLSVDSTPPTISPDADPNPVIDQRFRTSVVTITTDDSTVCWVDGNSISGDETLPSSYTTTHTTNFTYLIYDTNLHVFNYTARCKNLAGLENEENFTITVQFTGAFLITVLSPDRYVSDSDVQVRVSTPISTSCEFNGTTSMDTTDNLIHTSDLGALADGDYSYDVECTSTNETESTTVDFTVDTTSPVNVSINASDITCAADGLSATFSATDNLGISHYNYSIRSGSVNVVNLTTTTSTSVSHGNVNITDNTAYTWSMVAVDLAGNSQTASATVRSSSSNTCDTFRPSLVLNVTGTAFSKQVEVVCVDDISGCATSYNYSIVDEGETCISPEYEKPATQKISLVPPKRVCVWMADKIGNVAFEELVVDEDSSGPGGTGGTGSTGGGGTGGTGGTSGSGGECGDGVIDIGESCDGNNLAGLSCDDLGTFVGGSLSCTSVCRLDTSACVGGGPKPPSCGDGQISAGESCDGANTGGVYCQDLGFTHGIMRCDNCELDSSRCSGKQVEVDRPTQTGPSNTADPNDPNDPNFPEFPGLDDPEPEKKASTLAIIFIILGLLMSMGGGGYLGYKKYYGQGETESPGPTQQGNSTMQQTSSTPSRRSSSKPQPKQPTLDDIRAQEKSKLLSDVRKKQKKKERDKLFDSFDKGDDNE